MYRLILYNVIYILVFVWWIMINCLKGAKRGDAESKKTLKTAKSIPITYETDPAVLEKERRLKIAENREKMRKKREKKMNKTMEEFKEAQITMRKLKEEKMLSEDSTQPMNSDSIEKTGTKSEEIIEPENIGKVDKKLQKELEKLEKTQIPKNEKKVSKSLNSGSFSEEDLGDVKLVDEDPYAAAKKHIIKKRAQELARRKQNEELIRKRLERENCSYLTSPDDTLKNISSIQFESQISQIQRKKKQRESKESSAESQDGTLVEPKSNELYIQDIPERVMQ
ncbi:hypothetical protein L5515_013655 [Caenorhabditis briggsae]|uniref:Uncharacterized protein n=1 Tax=Caenorhabditis briggsae TaxID=6238 RepID=A0AAE9E9B8_CAEBR|nr:hypothetical protein L5515_013655 [Caenorhabditis briggsae]